MKSELQNNFKTLCQEIYFYDNVFSFPFESVYHNSEFESIVNDSNYHVIVDKMSNLITILNQDHSILNKDLESEIWDMI